MLSTQQLATPTDLDSKNLSEVFDRLNGLLANIYGLYLKTKNFHWHLSGSRFRDLHLLFDEQADQLLAMTDPIAERVRKLGGITAHSLYELNELQDLENNEEDFVSAEDMVKELLKDNQTICKNLRTVRQTCDKAKDFASVALIEVWLDETERRIWFLFELSQ